MNPPFATYRELLADPDVDLARAAGGMVEAGRWQLRLPAVFGFCGGVHGAVRLLQQALESKPAGGRVWLLGEIIHNQTVTDAFAAAGATVLAEEDLARVCAVAGPADRLVIPAFGLPKAIDATIRQQFRPEQIVDTTCRYVYRIWAFVETMSAAHFTLVIHGKPKHPETLATRSRAVGANNAVLLLPTVEHARRLAEAIRRKQPSLYPEELTERPAAVDLGRLALVNQTTMLFSETREVERLLRTAVEEQGGILRASETVCRATQQRQDAALDLVAHTCDLLLVVGGFASSNTLQLYRLARAVRPTYFIGTAAALRLDSIRHFDPDLGCEVDAADWLPPTVRTIGILAGASCPACDVGDIIRRFRQWAGQAG